MKAFGSQIIAEFIHCERDILNHAPQLEALLSEGIRRYDLQLKSISSYQFEPVGVTAIAIIGESHVAIHTYPEAGHLSLDIFTCSPGAAGPRQLMDFLKAVLQPEYVRFKELRRGLSVDVIDTDHITGFTTGSFDIRYHIAREVLAQRTAYQQLVIIDNKDFGRMLFLDHALQIATADAARYSEALVQPLLSPERPLHRVALLGGADGGVLNTLLAQGAHSVDLVTPDEAVIQAARTHLTEICGTAFEHPGTRVHLSEARSFLQSHQGFDALVCDLPLLWPSAAPAETASALPALCEAMQQSLMPGGRLTLHLGPASDQRRLERIRSLLEARFEALAFEPVYLPSFCEARVFGRARRAA